MAYFAVSLLFVNIVLMLYFYLKIRKNFSQNSYTESIRNKMQDIMRDFNFQTDQAITILEDKISQLQETVIHADKRLSALSSQKEKLQNEEAVIKTLSGQDRTKPGGEKNPAQKKIAHDKKTAISDKSEVLNNVPIDIYTKKIGGENSAIITPAASSAVTKNRIIDMAKKGASAEYIAERVDRPLGEVELIISMNL